MRIRAERTTDIQKRLDIEVISGQYNFEEHLLVHIDKPLVPLRDLSSAFPRLILVLISVCGGKRFSTVMLAVFENLFTTREGCKERGLSDLFLGHKDCD